MLKPHDVRDRGQSAGEYRSADAMRCDTNHECSARTIAFSPPSVNMRNLSEGLQNQNTRAKLIIRWFRVIESTLLRRNKGVVPRADM